jgi:hypothetical protein
VMGGVFWFLLFCFLESLFLLDLGSFSGFFGILAFTDRKNKRALPVAAMQAMNLPGMMKEGD